MLEVIVGDASVSTMEWHLRLRGSAEDLAQFQAAVAQIPGMAFEELDGEAVLKADGLDEVVDYSEAATQGEQLIGRLAALAGLACGRYVDVTMGGLAVLPHQVVDGRDPTRRRLAVE